MLLVHELFACDLELHVVSRRRDDRMIADILASLAKHERHRLDERQLMRTWTATSPDPPRRDMEAMFTRAAIKTCGTEGGSPTTRAMDIEAHS